MPKATRLREHLLNKRRWCGVPVVFVLGLASMCLYTTLERLLIAERLVPVGPALRHAVKTSTNKKDAPTETAYQSKPRDTLSSNSTRLQHLVQTCKRIHGVIPPPVSADAIPPSNIVELHHAIVYCSIPKVGSSFWKRVLNIMNELGRTSSLFPKQEGGNKILSFGQIRETLDDKEMAIFINSSLSFLFVREPYGRLLSGYVDKFYNPNFVFWKKIGKNIVRLLRKNDNKASAMCGHDVTFQEFVKAILIKTRTQEIIDGHFIPMYSRCNPCQYQYDFLGKMETFQQDSAFLLAKWQNQYSDLNLQIDEVFPNQSIISARMHVHRMFGAKKHFTCTKNPAYYFLLRNWRQFQIRGLISKRIAMPVSTSEAGAIDQRTFENIVLTAIKQSVNRTELKQQREEALIQAYQSVPLEDMEQLRRYVLRDCQYFGYDDRPEKLFQRSSHKTADGFNYFPGLTARLIHNSSL